LAGSTKIAAAMKTIDSFFIFHVPGVSTLLDSEN